MDEKILQYIGSHIDPEPAPLARLYRNTHLTMLYPHMCTDHLQGRLLTMLTRIIAPRTAVEIGTFSGYSALCIAEGLADDNCRLHTFEIDDEHENFIRNHFEQTEYGRRIRLHIGDARQLLPHAVGQPVDMAYVDANKRQYVDYYELLLPLMAQHGVIIADNTLWAGKVADPDCHDAQTKAIRDFNDHVAADNRVERVILPLRDGLTLIRKK